ncbi:MAG: insulinase family protein [Fimbriimonas sp.]|nr:insulinase family protein [Fimbriimonas sp.]
MLAYLACLLVTQAPVLQPARLRTILPNGAAILVENIPGAKSLSVQLFAASRGTEETPISNGLRHLLEHIVAKGPKGDLDRRLETIGGFLTAETSRDAMAFRLSLPTNRLAEGLQFCEELMHMPSVTPDDIRHEASILEQEGLLRSDSTRFSSVAWAKAYGDKGLDPFGNLDVIRNATPAMLDAIHKVQFAGPNLVVSVAGDVDLDVATKACSDLVGRAPKLNVTPQERPKGEGGQAAIDLPGIAYSVPVPGFRLPETAARLAAALALASEADRCYVLYTPSANPGMITLGRSDDKAGLVRVLSKADANDLFARGLIMARAWLRRSLDTPEDIAATRGLLIASAVDLKPDVLIENLNAMTHRQFAAAIESFRSNEAVVVTGR